MKEMVLSLLDSLRHEAIDLGSYSKEPVDYPDYALEIGKSIRSGNAQRAIFICGSGVGASIAANKVSGLRAGLCHDTFSAHQSVEDDDANVLCIGANVIGERLAEEIIHVWLNARFSGLERHRRRVNKIIRMEREVA
jgi:RpiB/LacA/LacB family sugar-phosphate isomerase